MASKITKQDIELLKHIAEFKILTVKQLAVLSQRSLQVIRRRLRVLYQEGLVEKQMRGYGRSKGTPSRHTTLCRPVQKMPPSDFVWLTDQSNMFKNGLGDKIWYRGSKTEKPSESILGSFAFKAAGI